MSFTSIGSFNSGLWKGGVTNTVSGITLVNFYTEAYLSWNPVKNATSYQVSVTGVAGGNSYTTANTYQLFRGLTDGTGYAFNISAYVGASSGPIKQVLFTTLTLPTYNTGNSGTVTRTNSPNGVDSVWTFKDGNIIDFNLFSDICLNVIGVGTGSSSVLNPNTGTYITGGGGGQVIYKDQFRVYNYYQKSPSIDYSYNFSITVGNFISPGSISLDINSSFATTPNFNDPFYNVLYLSNGIDSNSLLYNSSTFTYGGNNSSNAGGGGAGTFGNGLNASSNIGGNGGPGIGFTINNVVYGAYGGGGGGYGNSQSGIGGIGGGGNSRINGNGLANTGGGAGGSNSTTIQKQGGSGVVVIVGTTSLLPSIVSGLSYGNIVGNATTNTYSVDISYNQSVNNVAGYFIQFSGNVTNTTSRLSGNSFVFNSPTILVNNYSGLNGGNTYTINAYTIGTYGNSVSSNITIPQYTLPPTNLSGNFNATTANSITFSFTSPNPVASIYNATIIDVSNSANIFYANNISGSLITANVSGLISGNIYNISMVSINSYGISLPSNILTYGTAPNPPINLLITGNTATTISITFTQPSMPITKYYVTANTVANSFSAPATTYTIYGLKGLTQYNINLIASNNYGNSIQSSTSSGSTTDYASGGIKTVLTINSIQYNIHTFASNGTFIIYSGITSIDILLVAGGGSGNYNGGGGGGEVKEIFSYNISNPGSFTIKIGVGGNNSNGGNSSIKDSNNNNTYLANGGIAGGNGINNFVGGNSGNGLSGTIFLQNPVSYYHYGGGGGAGNAAPTAQSGNYYNNNTFKYGNGGDGKTSIINNNTYYGGGGSGALINSGNLSGNKIGGKGGGGSSIYGATSGFNGTTNTGGGGAYKKYPGSYAGGSGIVIIRFITPI